MKNIDIRLLAAAKKFGTPLYVYDRTVLEARCKQLRQDFPHIDFHYAVKANSNPTLLGLIRKEGIGAEAVSLGELAVAKAAGFKRSATSFTCSNVTEKELRAAARSGARVHLDSLGQLEMWGKFGLGRDVSLRLNQGIGAGHHEHVITGGPSSKFGISLRDIPAALRIAKRHKLRIVGLQQHIGSNVLDAGIFLKAAKVLLGTAEKFEYVTHIDFGGGLGIPYHTTENKLDTRRLGRELAALMKAFEKKCGRTVSFAMEPGRFLVAEAGTLLVSVVDAKSTEKRTFVGVNSGFNHLIRPAMYDSYHPIRGVSRKGGKSAHVTLAGNVCESGDVFAVDRPMPLPQIGDVLAIENAGAYGFSMSSLYNLRKQPREVLIDGSRLKDISFSPARYSL